MEIDRLHAELARCGKDNCMGRLSSDVTNWVTAGARDAAVAAERERIAQHFDARDRGPDGKPMGIGFYDPHEPAEIIRALGPNVS